MRAEQVEGGWIAKLLGTIGCFGVLMGSISLGAQVRLVTLDPGHFHAALVQKFMYPQVDAEVHVYAPEGEDLRLHLKRIEDFNARAENPTRWKELLYTGPDFLERMVKERAGNVIVIAGNNTRKTEYIEESVKAGFNVLADKPMAITPKDFELLRKAFATAANKKVLLYDIMTERFETTSILQRELARDTELFGKLEKGTLENPGVVMESVHYFFKEVAGKPLIRPAWFFDVRQEGEAIPDVGSHLIDQVQWICFPDQALNWDEDVKVTKARRWATPTKLEQFARTTGVKAFPDFLKKDVGAHGDLDVFANGEVAYTLRGVNARVTARWDFEAPAGGKDTHSALLRGTRANLEIKMGPEQRFVGTLFVQNNSGDSSADFEKRVRAAIKRVAVRYPGIDLKPNGEVWEVVVPEKYHVGHEAHFAQVTERFLGYLEQEKLPDWEVPNMIAKYYTTTEAYRLSHAESRP